MKNQNINPLEKLVRKLGLNRDRNLTVISPIECKSYHEGFGIEGVEIFYMVYDVHICVDGEISCYDFKRGYTIVKHTQVSYSDDSKRAIFEVTPRSPTIGLRNSHYVTDMTQDDLVKRLKEELEVDLKNRMKSKERDILTQISKGEGLK